MATFTWFGGSGNADDGTNWTPSGGPPRAGDTGVVNSGTVQATDSQLNSNTLLLNAGTFQAFNTLETVASSSFDSNTTLVAGSSGAAALDIFGGFLNDGTIEAAGNTVTIAIGADVNAGTTIAGTLVNDGVIAVLSGATLDVTGSSGNTFQGGSVDLKGATAVITATDSGSNYTLDDTSTLALRSAGTNVSVNCSGTADLLALNSTALSSTININGFGNGDTLDIGAETIGTIVYQSPQSGGSNAPILTIIGTNGATLLSDPFSGANGGLFGHTNGTFVPTTLASGTVEAGPFELVTATNGDTLLEQLPPSAWEWTDADPSNMDDPSNWALVSGPGNEQGSPNAGDTVFANNATFAFSSNNTVNGNTIFLTGTSEASFVGTQAVTGSANTGGKAGISFQNPTVDQTSIIANDPLPPSSTTLNFAGYNINEGTLTSNAGPGSHLTINVTQNGTASGYFINYGEIEAAPGNAVIIAVTGTSELFNAGLIYANGGTVVIDASPSGIAGGYAPMLGGVALIGDGGTIVYDTGDPLGTEGSNPVFAFYDGDGGDTLKLEQAGQFGGRILGFQQGDIIDLGGALNVGAIAVTADGRVMLDNPGGTVLASLVLSTGAYNTGTFAVTAASPGILVADGFTLTTGSDGNTQLTTDVVNAVWNDTSGTWQTAADWSTGVVPGATSTAVIGINATGGADGTTALFDITTGTTAVTIDSLSEVNSNATLQVTSDTTVGTGANLYGINQIAGEIEITGGNTLTSTFLKQLTPSADLQVDPGAVLAIIGHSNLGFANAGTLSEFTVVNGTSFANGNTIGLFVLGTATVDGGTIDAGPVLNGTSVVSTGGLISIGQDGGGAPATMTVEDGGTVIDTYADLSSDPTSFGSLTLTGAGTTWDDAGDPTDSFNTRGDMLVGNDNQSGNQPSPSPSGTAQLLVENDATLNEANEAEIGQSADSAGSATITSGGVWNIGTSGADGGTGGFLDVGNSGSGTLDIDGGSVNVLAGSGTFTEDGTIVTGAQGVGIGHHAGSDGTVVVSGGGGLNITISATIAGSGLGVGQLGQGELDIYDGGTVTVTDGGISAGSSLTGVGTIVVGGTSGGGQTGGLNALLIVAGDTLGGGMSIGKSGAGTLFVNTGGTVQVSDGSINVGNSAGAYGFAEIDGGLVKDTTNGLNIGNAGTGTLELLNAGTISLNGGGVDIGESLGAQGLLEIASGGLLTSATNGMDVGLNAGSTGTLAVLAGGIYNIGTHGISAGVSAGSVGTILVDGTGALIHIGTETAGNGVDIGQGGAGFLTVQGTGTLSDAGASITVGQNAGSTGTVEVASGGLITTSGTIGITVGGQGSGLLTIGAGGTVAAGNFFNIAQGSGSGSVVVNGGTLGDNGIFNVGDAGSGTLVVEGGGVVEQTGINFNIGGTTGGQGVAVVDGGTLVAGDGMLVGGPAAGTLDVGAAGTVTLTSGVLSIGDLSPGSGTVQVSGAGALISAQGGLILGGSGAGALSIGGGGGVDAGTGFVDIGNQPGGSGNLTVGVGGTLLAGSLAVAASPSGTSSGIVTIASGGLVDTNSLIEGAGGAITVGGSLAVAALGMLIGQSGSGLPAVMAVSGVLSDSGVLTVGNSGAGSLIVQGGEVELTGGSALVAGSNSGGNGAVTIDGGILDAGTSAVTLGNVSGSTGAVSVESGGIFSAGNIAVGGGTAGGTATGALTVSGAGSQLTALGQVEVGQGGTGNLLIENQASVFTGASTLVAGLDIGTDAGASGNVTISGTLSLLSNTGRFVVGDAGLGSLSIQSGATVITSAGATIANSASASGSAVNVTGTGSDWQVGGLLEVGSSGSGALSISDGATVTAGTFDAALTQDAVGQVSVTGPGSDLAVTGAATIADDGTGVLSVLGGATISAGTLTIGSLGDASGALVVSGAGSYVRAGLLDIGTALGYGDVTVGPGAFVNAGVIDGNGQVVLEGGTLDPLVDIIEAQQSQSGNGGVGGVDTDGLGFILNEGTVGSQVGKGAGGATLTVAGTVVGGGSWSLDGTAQPNAGGPGILLVGTGSTMVLLDPVLNAATTTFQNDLSIPETYIVNDSVIDVVFAGASGVLRVDDIGGFGGTIASFVAGDTIAVQTPGLATFSQNGSVVSVIENGDTLGVLTFATPGLAQTAFTTANALVDNALCFLAGTLIGTVSEQGVPGQTEVERLAVGDLVLTASGQARPVVWIGHGRVLATRGRRNAATPVIVRKGALGPNVPHADLRVTKGHSLYLDDVLIPVEFLVNHRSILWDDRAQEVSVYHVELETHDVLLANGAEAESFRNDGNRWLFQNAYSGWDLPAQEPCAPVLTGGAVVDAVWRRLLDRAGPRPSVPLTEDADLCLLVDGVRVDPSARTRPGEGASAGGRVEDVFVFAMSGRAGSGRAGSGRPGSVRVVSRGAAPQEIGVTSDPRCLGVAVLRVVVRQGTRFRVVRGDDPVLAEGFHAFEPQTGLRWTDGDAVLPVALFAGFEGPCEVVVHLGGTAMYVEDGRGMAVA